MIKFPGPGEVFHPSKLGNTIHSLKLVIILTSFRQIEYVFSGFGNPQFFTLTGRELLS